MQNIIQQSEHREEHRAFSEMELRDQYQYVRALNNTYQDMSVGALQQVCQEMLGDGDAQITNHQEAKVVLDAALVRLKASCLAEIRDRHTDASKLGKLLQRDDAMGSVPVSSQKLLHGGADLDHPEVRQELYALGDHAYEALEKVLLEQDPQYRENMEELQFVEEVRKDAAHVQSFVERCGELQEQVEEFVSQCVEVARTLFAQDPKQMEAFFMYPEESDAELAEKFRTYAYRRIGKSFGAPHTLLRGNVTPEKQVAVRMQEAAARFGTWNGERYVLPHGMALPFPEVVQDGLVPGQEIPRIRRMEMDMQTLIARMQNANVTQLSPNLSAGFDDVFQDLSQDPEEYVRAEYATRYPGVDVVEKVERMEEAALGSLLHTQDTIRAAMRDPELALRRRIDEIQHTEAKQAFERTHDVEGVLSKRDRLDAAKQTLNSVQTTRAFLDTQDLAMIPSVRLQKSGYGYEAFLPTEWYGQVKNEREKLQSQVASLQQELERTKQQHDAAKPSTMARFMTFGGAQKSYETLGKKVAQLTAQVQALQEEQRLQEQRFVQQEEAAKELVRQAKLGELWGKLVWAAEQQLITIPASKLDALDLTISIQEMRTYTDQLVHALEKSMQEQSLTEEEKHLLDTYRTM